MFIILYYIKLFCAIPLKISHWLSNWMILFTNKSLDVIIFFSVPIKEQYWKMVEVSLLMSLKFYIAILSSQISVIPVPSSKILITVAQKRWRVLLLLVLGQVKTFHTAKSVLASHSGLQHDRQHAVPFISHHPWGCDFGAVGRTHLALPAGAFLCGVGLPGLWFHSGEGQ